MNLLPVAVPHPTGPQHEQEETNREKNKRIEQKRSDTDSWGGNKRILKKERTERKPRCATARSESGRRGDGG